MKVDAFIGEVVKGAAQILHQQITWDHSYEWTVAKDSELSRFVTLIICYYFDLIEVDEMGGTCGTYGCEHNKIQGIDVEN
jgi:hypothetical protein